MWSGTSSALRVSVTLSWIAKTTERLRMYRLEFSARVLQRSDSFSLNVYSLCLIFILIPTFFYGFFRRLCFRGLFSDTKIWKIDFFVVQILQIVFNYTHAFGGKTFNFVFHNKGVLILHLHTVELWVSVTTSSEVITTKNFEHMSTWVLSSSLTISPRVLVWDSIMVFFHITFFISHSQQGNVVHVQINNCVTRGSHIPEVFKT